MKTAELTGALLDYWVARAEGIETVLWANEGPPDQAACILKERRPNAYPTHYQPSSNWLQGGPIIERERIKLQPTIPTAAIWYASIWMDSTLADGVSHRSKADAPLVAAMRAYVASKFSAEVPDDAERAA